MHIKKGLYGLFRYFCVKIPHKQNVIILIISIKGFIKVIEQIFIALRWWMVYSAKQLFALCGKGIVLMTRGHKYVVPGYTISGGRWEQTSSPMTQIQPRYHLVVIHRPRKNGRMGQPRVSGAVVQWLSLLDNFIQLSLNSGSAQVESLLAACRRFAMVRISDNGSTWK